MQNFLPGQAKRTLLSDHHTALAPMHPCRTWHGLVRPVHALAGVWCNSRTYIYVSAHVCVPQVLEYAARWHPDQEIVSKSVEGPITVSTYADLAQRAKLCAVALQRLGIR